MKKIARVIVTYDCSRNCQKYCNQHIKDVPEVHFEDLLEYEELVITGGEPMLIGPRVVEMIHRLRAAGYKGLIWLYSADINVNRWPDIAVLKEVSGITYTFHYEYIQKDIMALKRLTEYLSAIDTSNMHNRLIIDSRLLNEFNWEDIIPGMGSDSWDCIRWLEWKTDECPIPDNEELVFYDLEKDN